MTPLADVLAIDPGIRNCGCALFAKGELDTAWLARNPVAHGDDLGAILGMANQAHTELIVRAEMGMRPIVDLLVVEWPQVYTGGKAKGDPRDLLTLAGVDAAIAASVSARAVRRYFPREWKGQVDADKMLDRILERLRPHEVARIEKCPASLRHNVIDAIGIGLRACGRLEPRRILPGAT